TSKDMTESYDKDFNQCDLNYIESAYVEDKDMFYYVGGIGGRQPSEDNYHYITSLYVDKDILDKMRASLNTDNGSEYRYKTKLNNVYLISFKQLKEIRFEVISSYLYDEFKDIVNVEKV